MMFIINTSEVWAILIPLAVWYKHTAQPRWMYPMILYLVLAFCTNLVGDLISYLQETLPEDERKHHMLNNLYLYNLHCIFRFFCLLAMAYLGKIMPAFWLRTIAGIFLLAMLMHPLLGMTLVFAGPHELNISTMNANLMTLEAFLLLIPCMVFYLKLINSETTSYSRRKDFWAVTGITMYLVINFFLYLFYTPLFLENFKLAATMWTFHNIAYTVFCIFIAIALYLPNGDDN